MKVKNTIINIITVIAIVCVSSFIITSIMFHKPSIFGYRAFYIMSESMEPTIMTGQLVLGETIDAEDVQSGDIIAYKKGNKMIIHRVIVVLNENGNLSYVFKGDNNQFQDKDMVDASQIMYKIIKY
jgi:signal peptidase